MSLSCTHRFHRRCVSQFSKHADCNDSRSNCPCCRVAITEDDKREAKITERQAQIREAQAHVGQQHGDDLRFDVNKVNKAMVELGFGRLKLDEWFCLDEIKIIDQRLLIP
mgnify:CR=1 FL=1